MAAAWKELKGRRVDRGRLGLEVEVACEACIPLGADLGKGVPFEAVTRNGKSLERHSCGGTRGRHRNGRSKVIPPSCIRSDSIQQCADAAVPVLLLRKLRTVLLVRMRQDALAALEYGIASEVDRLTHMQPFTLLRRHAVLRDTARRRWRRSSPTSRFGQHRPVRDALRGTRRHLGQHHRPLVSVFSLLLLTPSSICLKCE
jgi:hypothetical protein